jgi:hypothetical protein
LGDPENLGHFLMGELRAVLLVALTGDDAQASEPVTLMFGSQHMRHAQTTP